MSARSKGIEEQEQKQERAEEKEEEEEEEKEEERIPKLIVEWRQLFEEVLPLVKRVDSKTN